MCNCSRTESLGRRWFRNTWIIPTRRKAKTLPMVCILILVHEWMSVPSSSKPLLSWCLCLRSSKIPPGDLSEDEWRKIEAPGRISSRINDFLSLQLMREMNGGVAAIAKKPLKDAEAGEGCSGGRTAGRANRCGDCPPEVHHEIVSSTLRLTRYAVCLIRGQGEEKAGEPIAHYLALLPCILLHPSPFR